MTARERLGAMLDGYRRTALVHVAAQLGLADRLADGPRTAAELAAATGADAGKLRRVARALVGMGVLTEDGGSFALTEVGELLRADVPGSMHSAAVYFGGLSYRAYSGLGESLTSGGTAFDHVFGEPYFEHLDRHPDLAAHYHRLIALPPGAGTALASLHDFTAYRTIVDVGGGNGSMLAEILEGAPDSAGVVHDLPFTEPSAAAEIAARPAGARMRFTAGDFRVSVPPGGDAYLLSRVLANWPDETAVKILANCRAAMGPAARLLVFEMAMPEHIAPGDFTPDGDLNALAHMGGAVRTRAQFAGLLADAGFAEPTATALHGSAWTLLETGRHDDTRHEEEP